MVVGRGFGRVEIRGLRVRVVRVVVSRFFRFGYRFFGFVYCGLREAVVGRGLWIRGR